MPNSAFGSLQGKPHWPKQLKLKIRMARRDNQDRFPSKQRSRFLWGRPQSTNIVLFKMIQNPYFLFLSFLQKFDWPEKSKFMLM